MKTIGVLTSGGDSPGMNAAIRAVTRSALYAGYEVCGICRGYEGLLDVDYRMLDDSAVSDIMQRGGTMLRTARSERFMTKAGLQLALEHIEHAGLDAIVVIGGDGSMRGALTLQQSGIPVICLPGTIDNDLAYTDFTIGFDTAVNTVLDSLGNIRDTSSSHDRTTIIEVMGRHCGDIALMAGIAGGAESILIPEDSAEINSICSKLIKRHEEGKVHSIIIRAEGFHISTEDLAEMIQQKTGIQSRTVVLSYVQRGGSPTAFDRLLASRMGYYAVELLQNQNYGRAVGISKGSIIDLDLKKALDEKKQYDSNDMKLAEILSR